MTRARLVLIVLLGVLGVLAGAAAAGETLWDLADTPQRLDRARADARKLAEDFMPKPAALGAGWHRPWEAPRGVPGVVAGQEAWWKRLRMDAEWAQFFGLEEDEIVERVRTRLDQVWSGAGDKAGAGVPPELASLAGSKSAFLSVPMMSLRRSTLLAQMPQVLAVERLETVAHAYLRARFLEDEEAAQAAVAARVPDLLHALDADLSGLSYDEALRAYAREARSVRRRTTMVYLHAEPKAWLEPQPVALPAYAMFTVDLYVLAREAIGTRVVDVTEENLASVRTKLAESLKTTWALSKEIATRQVGEHRRALDARIDELRRSGAEDKELEWQRDQMERQLAELAATAAARPVLEVRARGENAWVLTLEDLPALQQRRLSALQARLRNGNAIADVKAQGTYDEAFMLEHLDHLMAALDESTRVFAED